MGYIVYIQQTGLLLKKQDAGKLLKRLWRIIPELSAFPIPPLQTAVADGRRYNLEPL